MRDKKLYLRDFIYSRVFPRLGSQKATLKNIYFSIISGQSGAFSVHELGAFCCQTGHSANPCVCSRSLQSPHRQQSLSTCVARLYLTKASTGKEGRKEGQEPPKKRRKDEGEILKILVEDEISLCRL